VGQVEDVNRAVAILNVAMANNMFPQGAIPESDSAKLVEAEKIVAIATQAEAIGNSAGPAKIAHWDAIQAVLFEARVGIGANGNQADAKPEPSIQAMQPHPAQPQPGAQPSSSPPSQPAQLSPAPSPSPPVEPTSAPATATPSSGPSSPPSSSPASSSSPGQPSSTPADSQPKALELWSGAGSGRWFVTKDLGVQVEAVSEATGETTLLPKGFLKEKVTEGFVQVEVDGDWNIQGARGYNTLWYAHPGCTKWPVPLDDMLLPSVGEQVECAGCSNVFPVASVEPNGYVPRPTEPAPQQLPPVGQTVAPVPHPVLQVPAVAQATSAPVEKQPCVTLTAYPDRGVKIYEHPGCHAWEAQLYDDAGIGKPLLQVGAVGQCQNCGEELPLTKVEANGFVPGQPRPQAPPPAQSQPPVEPQSSPAVSFQGQPGLVFSSAQQALVDPNTLQPVQPQPQQEALPSSPSQSAPSSPSPSGGSPSSPPTTPAPAGSPSPSPQPSSEASPPSSGSGTSSSEPSASVPGPNIPADDVEGDAEYAGIVERVEANYAPTGMPVPQELEDPPTGMPEDPTENEALNRVLHMKYRGVASRARYLFAVEHAKAKEIGRLRKLLMKGAMREARKELGKDATLAEVRERAEEDEAVARWLEREAFHADRADAYKTFFEVYESNVETLSRDLTFAVREERGA